MMKNDLTFMLPDINGHGVCNLAIKELCRATVNFISDIEIDDASYVKFAIIFLNIYLLYLYLNYYR